MYALFRGDFDEEKAAKEAKKGVNIDERWSDSDCYIFYGLFTTFGRNFAKIHQIVRGWTRL